MMQDEAEVKSLTQHAIKVLLVDDQAMIGEAVRRMLVSEEDIIFRYCGDAKSAVETALEFSPTVILQDLVMPDIDGLTLVKHFRENAATRDIPMIVLSTKEEPTVKAEAFAIGANDYLVKLPDKIELIARIRYHSKGYINLLQRNEAYQRLAKELAEAADYVISLLPEPLAGEVKTEWKFIPSTQLGGDSFGYHWLDSDHLAVYLLDVCGHGVGAALLSVSVMNVLRSQTLPSTNFYNPSEVLEGLNQTFQMSNQNNMYFTMWYGVYDKTSRVLEYCSGGHPPAILISGMNQGDADTKRLSTPCLVIGALPGAKFKSAACEIPPSAELYVFSDGAYEVTRPDESMMDLDEFVQLLCPPPHHEQPAVERIVNHLRSISRTPTFDDDVSILRVVF